MMKRLGRGGGYNLDTPWMMDYFGRVETLPRGLKPPVFIELERGAEAPLYRDWRTIRVLRGLVHISVSWLNRFVIHKPESRLLPLVGMTNFSLDDLFSSWLPYSRRCRVRKDGAPLVCEWQERAKARLRCRLLPLVGMTRFVFGAMLIFVFAGSAGAASPWGEPGRDLARKIAEITGPGAVAVEVGNRSSLSKGDVAAVKVVVETELAASGVHLAGRDQAAAVVVVTLAENVREYVWVAEIVVGKNEKAVVMVAVARPEAGAVQASGSGVVMRKQLLWTQEEAILDVAALDAPDKNSGTHMAVLDGAKVTLLHFEKGKWLKDQELPVGHEQAWPRDLRGRLVVGKDHLLDVYLPGVVCTTVQHGGLALECAANDEAWPIEGGLRAGFDAKRNYFTGVISPGLGRIESVPAFYSAVALPREKYILWVFAATDGTVHAVDGMTDQVWRGVPWGSDIAAVHTGCGSGWQVVAAGKADTGKDELTVYDVPDREPLAMSAGLSFPGRITALWGGGLQEALAVVRNGEAGRYEAYRVTFACGE